MLARSFLLRQREAADFARIARIGDVDDAIDFPVQPRRARRGVHQIAAVVEISVRSRAAGFEMADLFRPGRLAHVENEKSFRSRLAVGAAPAGRDSFQARDHLAVGDLDLNRPGILRSGNDRCKTPAPSDR